MKNAGTVRARTFCNFLEPLIKTLKDKAFVSFNIEFNLKTSENHLKS